MIIKTILTGFILTFTMPLFVQCSGNPFQKSELPAKMPENTIMKCSENGGMAPTFKEIEISGNEIFIKEKTFQDKVPKMSYAEITNEEKAELYKVFVENKFDTIRNDERESIVYDAPSEGIYLRAGKFSKNISFGANSPISGSNLKRYQTIKIAISKLESKYQNNLTNLEINYAVIKYDPASHNFIFKNARSFDLDDKEISIVQNLTNKAVEEYNNKPKDGRKIQNLSEYKFQYIPVYDENREKQVWINAFCNDFDNNWRKELISVGDGGNCYFNFKINLTNSTFYDFSVNGDA